MPERKTKQFSVGVYDKKHLRNLSRRLRKVQRLLDDAAGKATAVGIRTGYKDIEKDFRFSDFPQAGREIDALLGELTRSLTVNVQEANSEAWGVANAKNDAMVDSMLGAAGQELGKKKTRRWYNKNERALSAFNRRVEDGMNLSSNVWRLDQFKKELELSLEMGLGRGKSAAELSRDVRSYLKYPDKLFRRVRDGKGVLRLSRAAQEFHPGQGVYRSSYKNALRLTATETNMAYRSADSLRWNQTEWVLGIRISVSKTNHPVPDICDELQGDYPKDFKFTGWHPFCKCFAVAIQPTPEKFMEYLNASEEEQKEWQWDDEVKETPKNFKDWLKDNEERISRAKTLPYFLKDNPKYVGVKQTSQAEPAKDIHDQQDTMSPELRARMELRNERLREYRRLLDDPDYNNVEFNEENAGVKATHREHNFDKEKGWYEKRTRDVGFKNGYSVVLESEKGKAIGQNYTEGLWNGLPFELASCEAVENNNNLVKGLKHCASKSETEIAVLFFPGDDYEKADIYRAIKRYHGLRPTLGDSFKDFKGIYVVSGEQVYKVG